MKTKTTDQDIIRTLNAYAQTPVYFYGKDDKAYIEYFNFQERIISRINSSEFKRFVKGIARRIPDLKMNKARLDDIIDEMDSIAFDSKIIKEVFVRVGYFGNEIIIDNNDSPRTYTIIRPGSWDRVTKSPVPFIKTPKQRPLPIPTSSEVDIWQMLEKYIVPKEPNSIILVLAFMVKNLIRDMGSCVIFSFYGEQDSGKSSSSELVKFLIDPTDPLLSVPPKTPLDVIVNSNHMYFLAYDNLSGISNELADFLCSVVYGVGHSVRKYYTNDEEVFYNLKRDILTNGIVETSKRPDFQDRVVQVELKSRAGSPRLSKTELQREMEKDRPLILHSLYDLLSKVLEILPTISEPNLPRMADYAQVGIAVEKALNLNNGLFLETYRKNLSERNNTSFWEDEVCSYIHEYLSKEDYGAPTVPRVLCGTAMELHQKFMKKVKGHFIPRNAKSFSQYLKRIESVLKKENIHVDRYTSHGKKMISISFIESNKDAINSL